jgi:hypothetical protein
LLRHRSTHRRHLLAAAHEFTETDVLQVVANLKQYKGEIVER